MKEKLDRRVVFSASTSQYNMWQDSLQQTTYKNMSDFIRSVMDMVCECIRANDTMEVLIIPYEIDGDDTIDLSKVSQFDSVEN